MAGFIERAGLNVLFRFDPETAHRLAIRGLSLGITKAPPPPPNLRTRVLGLDFPSPIGLAAGFDKNAEAVDGLLRLGFGFVEVGTVTPLPQAGNPKPRMFRLEADEAIINRLGFNNDGAETIAARLAARKPGGIVGVNLGANRASADRIADYVAGVDRFARIASYLVLNISSPNTPGLRGLQEAESFETLLLRAVAARDEAANGGTTTPLLVKIAPDLDDGALEAIARITVSSGIDGVVVGNTTLARTGLTDGRRAAEAGGLSGRPLFQRATIMLARLRKLIGPGLPLIGVGGVDTAEAALTKLLAGADLVQVYTGMIYRGHGIAARINARLAQLLAERDFASPEDAVGRETDRWAAMPLPG
ncbi:MAG: quinone-dependent dihydroorotate dehydrogenase [Bauldia sp.]|nr:quinone-dependent dihydroorotate dehydrogenase [Bauldia sp.]